MANSGPASIERECGFAFCGAFLFASLVMHPASARSQNSDRELTEDWRIGGVLEIESIAESNFDLEAGSPDALTLEPRLEISLAYAPESGMRLFAQLELSRSIFLQGGNGSRDERARAELRQAYVFMDGSVPGLTFQIGRQRFEDEREWWYDEDLEAARVRYQRGRFDFELAAVRNENPSRDALNRDRTKTGRSVFAVGRYEYADEAELGAYVIAQDASSEVDEKPVFVGLRSIGMIGPGISHWIDAAIVKGTDAGRDINAYGFDVGLEFLFDAPLQPSLHLGLAFGSGDRSPQDEVDSAFRQTGLQSSYFYYGEVLAPELSNMWIHTIGFELDTGGRTSIRVLYHQYRQHRASSTLRDALVSKNPDGQNRDLGEALDVTATHEFHDGAYLDLILGSFAPGTAFGPEARHAYFGQLAITYEF